MSTPAARPTTEAGIEALRRGDAASARQIFEQLVASGAATADTQLGLVYACSALHDGAAARAAIDATLALEPRNLRALMLKGDALAADGNGIGAASFYQAVVQVAPEGAALPPELRAEVERAYTLVDRYRLQFEQAMTAHLAPMPDQSPRFRQSVDILLGRRDIYVQQPLLYYFPELPQVQFYDRARFPWLDRLEAATADIRQELLAVMGQPEAFAPYVQGDPSRPMLAQGGLRDNPDWSAFYLWKNGQRIEANAARCPRTMVALEGAPLTRMDRRSPSVLFSLMRPGAHIPAHHGFVNTRLIVHLPLIVPPGCRFRVGSETREWQEGKAWVFDDTIEHEAWNDSDQTRVVLLFEIWRPELTLQERAQVITLFEGIDRQRGGIGDWSI